MLTAVAPAPRLAALQQLNANILAAGSRPLSQLGAASDSKPSSAFVSAMKPAVDASIALTHAGTEPQSSSVTAMLESLKSGTLEQREQVMINRNESWLITA